MSSRIDLYRFLRTLRVLCYRIVDDLLLAYILDQGSAKRIKNHDVHPEAATCSRMRFAAELSANWHFQGTIQALSLLCLHIGLQLPESGNISCCNLHHVSL
jgi:hypothetical protein